MRPVPLAVLTAVLAVTANVATASPRAKDPVGRRTLMLGRSVDGRPIVAIETGDLDSPKRALVVGCIHGNECAGEAVTTRLAEIAPVGDVDLWLVPDLNPDGAATGTRGNAHGVDLNRNFPWHWRREPGVFDSGPAPLSEPETRITYRLIERIHPAVSIWFHQHLDVVDGSGPNRAPVRAFARVARMRVRALARKPGSVVTWQSYCFPKATAFVVELPAGALPAASVTRLARAVRAATARAGIGGPGRKHALHSPC